MPKQPLVTIRTMNGYTLWFAPLTPELQYTEAGETQRWFVVRSPSGQEQDCAVIIAPSLREQIRIQTSQDHSPADGLWDTLCRLALQRHLMRENTFPPDVFNLTELTPRQWGTVLRLARPHSPERRR